MRRVCQPRGNGAGGPAPRAQPAASWAAVGTTGVIVSPRLPAACASNVAPIEFTPATVSRLNVPAASCALAACASDAPVVSALTRGIEAGQPATSGLAAA